MRKFELFRRPLYLSLRCTNSFISVWNWMQYSFIELFWNSRASGWFRREFFFIEYVFGHQCCTLKSCWLRQYSFERQLQSKMQETKLNINIQRHTIYGVKIMSIVNINNSLYIGLRDGWKMQTVSMPYSFS